MITVNGTPKRYESGITVNELLKEHDIDPDDAGGIAVAVDDEVVPRSKWGDITLSEEATVEIITATQGG